MLIAEIGSVHDGSFGNALKLIDLAHSCGADAVKFQTHIAEAESLPSAPSPEYFSDESRIQYFKRTSFTPEQWSRLKQHADSLNITFLSSPFSLEAVDILEKINMAIYKIPSGEVTNLPLLRKIASTRKPVYLSSGMSNWLELDVAVNHFNGTNDLTVLQCSSRYPCAPEHIGLNIIQEMKQRYSCKVGFSDHSLGISASLAAATLGASVIEKHLTFHRGMYGSDAKHSSTPEEFTLLSRLLSEIRTMLLHPVDKNDLSAYSSMKHTFQKSIVAASDLPAGTILRESHLAYKKPGTGIPADQYQQIIGRTLVVDCSENQPLEHSFFQ